MSVIGFSLPTLQTTIEGRFLSRMTVARARVYKMS
jgi:hypothetical protein